MKPDGVTTQFSDTSEGMGEIVRFLRAAVEDDGNTLTEAGDGLLLVKTGGSGQPEARLTASREQSLARPDVELLGLDHPLVVEYMARYRAIPAHEVGVRVSAGGNRTGVLSLWHVTTQGDRGEIRTTILRLAVDVQGQRIPSWDRQIDGLFLRPPAAGEARPAPGLLAEVLEPMIQRELLHRGVIGEKRGYDARLIGWVEVV